jgi:hypothetical protein
VPARPVVGGIPRPQHPAESSFFHAQRRRSPHPGVSRPANVNTLQPRFTIFSSRRGGKLHRPMFFRPCHKSAVALGAARHRWLFGDRKNSSKARPSGAVFHRWHRPSPNSPTSSPASCCCRRVMAGCSCWE